MKASILRKAPRPCMSVVSLVVGLAGCFDPSDTDPPQVSGSATSADDGGTEPPSDTSASGDPTQGTTGDPTSDTDDGATTDAGDTDSAASDDTSTGSAGGCDGVCIPEAPVGWQGPVVVHEGADAPPPCPGDFPALVHDELYTGLDAGDATCDCDCGDVVGASCGAATLEQAGNLCNGNVFDPNQWSLAPLACVAVNATAGNYFAIEPALHTAGASCSPMTTEQIPPPTWSASIRSCAMPASDTCEDGTCAPTLATEFDAVCIWIDGEASCPQGPYAAPRTAHADFVDDRDCSACSCADPQGVCAGEIVFTDGMCGGGAILVDAIPADSCGSLGDSAGYARWVPEIDADCAPSGGALQGGVEPTGTVTFCCLD